MHMIKLAAVLPVFIAAPALANDAIDWSGPYVGIAAGYDFGSSKHTYGDGNFSASTPDGLPLANSTFTLNGKYFSHGRFDIDNAVVAVRAGYNVQLKKLVFGIDAEFASGVKGSTKGTSAEPCLASGVDENGYCATKLKHTGSFRGRLGFATSRSLFFVSAGYAFTKLNAVRPFTSVDRTREGLIWGGGVEHALSKQVSVRVDYTRVDFGNRYTYNSFPLTVSNGLPYDLVNYKNGLPNHNVDARLNSLKLGVNYRF